MEMTPMPTTVVPEGERSPFLDWAADVQGALDAADHLDRIHALVDVEPTTTTNDPPPAPRPLPDPVDQLKFTSALLAGLAIIGAGALIWRLIRRNHGRR